MTDYSEFVAINNAESATIGGGVGWFATILIVYCLNNAGAFVEGVKDGYAASSPT